MSVNPTPDAIATRLAAVLDSVLRQELRLATVESRIDLIHDEVRRMSETTRRLKLAGDNAKRLSVAHAETLKGIDSRLDAFICKACSEA